MKIAILVSGFPPNKLGGMEIATYKIAKYLAKLGHEVHVINPRDDKFLVEREEAGFYVHHYKVIRKPILASISHFINIFKIIRKINPDILHLQALYWVLPAYFIKCILNKPFLVYGQGDDVYYPKPIFKVFYPYLLSKADAVISLTDDMGKAIKKICNRQIIIIPNGIDLDSYLILPRRKVRAQLGIKQDENVILYVGGLRPIKGVTYLVEAVDILIRNIPNIRLMIVGDGIERKRLEEQTKRLQLTNIITFIGQVSNEKVSEYMSVADMLVLPSLSEGFSVVILEAMAVGLPIVATRVRGNPDIIIEGKNGLLANPGDSSDLAIKIISLLNDKYLRNKISKNNKEEVKRYSLDNTVRQLESVYRQVLESYLVTQE